MDEQNTDKEWHHESENIIKHWTDLELALSRLNPDKGVTRASVSYFIYNNISQGRTSNQPEIALFTKLCVALFY